jgi:hypothetical protein
MKPLLAVALVLAAGCGRPGLPLAHLTMPNPEGCFVRVWEEERLTGASDFINGPRAYASLRDLPGGRNWQDRIRSVEVGPTATAFVWSNETFRGFNVRLAPGAQYPVLAKGLTADIESVAIECAGSNALSAAAQDAKTASR